MKARSIAAAVTVLTLTSLNLQAIAGVNDFFGSTIGGNGDGGQGLQGTTAGGGGGAQTPSGPPSGDYSGDEKRVQKKYKANVKGAQKLIAKGTAMMQSKDDKSAKKGRILKEIGERQLAELKANNPFPELADKPGKKIN